LDHGAHRAVARVQVADQVQRAVRINARLHVDAHEARALGGGLYQRLDIRAADRFVQVHAKLGELDGHVDVQSGSLDLVERAKVLVPRPGGLFE